MLRISLLLRILLVLSVSLLRPGLVLLGITAGVRLICLGINPWPAPLRSALCISLEGLRAVLESRIVLLRTVLESGIALLGTVLESGIALL